MADCSSTQADWQKLENIAKDLSNPKSIAMHIGKDILVNGKDIFSEVTTAVSDYKSSQWKDFGKQVGEAAAKVVLGEKKPTKAIDPKKI